jgi:hypothetical protein
MTNKQSVVSVTVILRKTEIQWYPSFLKRLKRKFKGQFYINIASSNTYITKLKTLKEPLMMRMMISSLSALSATPLISSSAQGQLPIKLIQ